MVWVLVCALPFKLASPGVQLRCGLPFFCVNWPFLVMQGACILFQPYHILCGSAATSKQCRFLCKTARHAAMSVVSQKVCPSRLCVCTSYTLCVNRMSLYHTTCACCNAHANRSSGLFQEKVHGSHKREAEQHMTHSLSQVSEVCLQAKATCTGEAGAKLRTALKNQAKPRVACGLACNRMHADAKGTTSNELMHRNFDRYTRNCGGTRRYDVLHALTGVQVYEQNGVSVPYCGPIHA